MHGAMTSGASGRAWDALRAADAQEKLCESPERGLDPLAKNALLAVGAISCASRNCASYKNPLNDGHFIFSRIS